MPAIETSTQLLKQVDVYDVLTPFDLASTPIFNEIDKGPNPINDLFDWPYDVPDDPTSAGSTDARNWGVSSTVDFGARAMMYGRLHHREVDYAVGVVAQGNRVWGTDGKQEFQTKAMKALRFLNKCAEQILVSNRDSVAGSNTVDLITRGLEMWINYNVGGQADTATQCPSAFRPASAQVVNLAVSGGDYSLAETDVRGVFKTIYDNLKSKIDLDVYCHSSFKQKVSDWGNLVADVSSYTKLRRFNSDAEDKKITNVIETWLGDCGTARFHLHPFLRAEAAQRAYGLGLDFRFLKLRVRNAPQTNKELAKQGTMLPGQAFMTFGLQCTPKHLAKWIGTS